MKSKHREIACRDYLPDDRTGQVFLPIVIVILIVMVVLLLLRNGCDLS